MSTLSPLTIPLIEEPSATRANPFGDFNLGNNQYGQIFGGGADNAQPSDAQNGFEDFMLRQNMPGGNDDGYFKSPDEFLQPSLPNTPNTWTTYLDPAAFRNQYGVASINPRSDLSGSSTKIWGIPDDYLSRALSQYNNTGSFAGAKNVPVNLEAGLDWVLKNYGSTVSQLPGAKSYEITNDKFTQFGNPGQYISLISSKNAGDTWGVWDKNADGTYTNKGISYYDSHKDHDNVLGSLLPLVLNFIPGLQGVGTMIGDALIGSSFLSPVVGNSILGGLTSAAAGGNPLTGALSGGVGAFLAGTNLAGDMGITDPMLQKAVNSTITSGAKQLVTGGEIDPESLLMNGVIGYGSNLAGTTIGQQAGLSTDATKNLVGGLNAFGRRLVSDSPQSRVPMRNNLYNALYQRYLQSKGQL